MAKKIKIIFIFSSLLVYMIGCRASMLAPTLADETAAKQKWNDASLTQLSDGYLLYVNKCAGCHYLHNPAEFSASKWEMEMPEMCKRAFLSADQQDKILRYVLTKREILLANANKGK